MRNCLVTKLKGTVDNDNLPYLGFFRVGYAVESSPSASRRFITVNTTEASKLFIKGGTFVDSSDMTTSVGTEIPVPANTSVTAYISNNDCVVYAPKYGLEVLVVGGADDYDFCGWVIDTDVFRYNPNIGFLRVKVPNEEDVFRNLSGVTNARNFTIASEESNFNGRNISELFPYLTGLTYCRFLTGGSLGDIISLGNNINCTGFVFNCALNGTAESLAAAQVANGRTSGKLDIDFYYGTAVTVNGAVCEHFSINFDSSLPNGYNITIR